MRLRPHTTPTITWWSDVRLRSRPLTVLGLITALCGLVTIIPGLEEVGMVFGLGLIGWFVWLGVSFSAARAPGRSERQSVSGGSAPRDQRTILE